MFFHFFISVCNLMYWCVLAAFGKQNLLVFMPCFLKYYLLVVVNDECSCTMTTSHSLDFFITCTRCYKLYHFDCLGHDSLMLPFSNSSRVLAKVLSLDRHSCAVFPSGLHSVDAVSLLAEQPKWRFHPLLGLSTPE